MQYYATDVDYAIIVMAITEPTFSSLILDKYLVLCEFGSVTPLIVLNKADLDTKIPEVLNYYKSALGIQTIQTSVIKDIGIETLKQTIQNKTCVFLGKSGVGKSSLINKLRGNDAIEVGNVSKRYGEGKHTTTSTEKYLIGDNTWVIDTPGLRNIDVTNIETHLLRELYPDFVKLQNLCKFNNCMHAHENKCAVKNAVESGVILQERYQNYLHIAGM